MIRIHIFTVPPFIVDILLLLPLLRRATRRLRKQIAHARRWV